MQSLDPQLAARLTAAVRARREELVALTQALLRERSLLGEEEGVQQLLHERLERCGFAVERVAIEPPTEPAESPTWGYPPLDPRGRTCVAGRIAGPGEGRSMHLSGHVDVVPVESPERWSRDPWGAELAGGRIWGRGAGDMKAGIASYLIAAEAYLEVCGAPRGELLFSSVIEEECTGNGMQAVLAAGYDAQGTLIGEPSDLRLLHAGVGVVWARLAALAGGSHPAFSSGDSSSKRLLRALAGLHGLEDHLNDRERPGAEADGVFFAAHERPFRLNVGVLRGGEWPSSEPVAAEAVVRIGFGLGLAPTEVQEMVSRTVAEASPDLRVSFEGFRAVAYCDDLEHDLARALGAAHELLHRSPPERQVLAATTDARSVAGPCVCYGPIAGDIHATDEWVDVDSMVACSEVVAVALAAWQGAS